MEIKKIMSLVDTHVDIFVENNRRRMSLKCNFTINIWVSALLILDYDWDDARSHNKINRFTHLKAAFHLFLAASLSPNGTWEFFFFPAEFFFHVPSSFANSIHSSDSSSNTVLFRAASQKPLPGHASIITNPSTWILFLACIPPWLPDLLFHAYLSQKPVFHELFLLATEFQAIQYTFSMLNLAEWIIQITTILLSFFYILMWFFLNLTDIKKYRQILPLHIRIQTFQTALNYVEIKNYWILGGASWLIWNNPRPEKGISSLNFQNW